MRKFLFLPVLILLYSSLCISQSNPAITSYVTFLQGQNQSAKDYILDLFKTHDIVIICERDHREITQYDLILDIIRDNRFIKNVGNVFTEIGVSNLNPALNTFLHTKNLSGEEQQKQILNFHRDLDWTAMWEKYNYTYLIQGLYNLNNQLPERNAISLYPSNIPLDWQKVDSTNYKATVMPLLKDRDSIIATQIIDQFGKLNSRTGSQKKALVIMNYRHAFNHIFYTGGKQEIKNVAAFLFTNYGDRVANVLLNCTVFDQNDHSLLLQQGKWDAAFAATGNKNVGFNLKKTPFGKDSFDLWMFKNDYTYQDIFTGFVFYKPIETHKLVTGVPGFLDPSYSDEFIRRWQLSTILLPNLKKFSKEEISDFKKEPQELQTWVNEKKEMQYPKIDSLVQIRNQWLK